MSPQKRPRITREEDEVNGIDSARLISRNNPQSKRRRLAAINHESNPRSIRSQSLVSSDDSDAEILDNDVGPPSLSTQYELDRDNGFRHLENPDLDDQRATQALFRRQGQIGDNHAANNAIIEEVTCINFMCHDKLHVKLGPLINFVVGMNGSGKSAVLTAITLCLGAKASSTNRGANLQSLIKGGRDQAILIVKLKNEGIDAYQPNLYGNSIIVERHFSRSSGSRFKLKATTGRVISTKRRDLEDLVEYFQLQVDNPMNVLTQDEAKSFITQSTAADKYQFFARGVQLETLNNDYNIIYDTCDSIAAKLEESKDDVTFLKKKARAAAEKFEAARKSEGLRKKSNHLIKKLAWSQVGDQESSLAEKERLVCEARAAVETAAGAIEHKDREFLSAEQGLQRARDESAQHDTELIPLREEEDTAKIAHEIASKDVKKAHSDRGVIKEQLAEARAKFDEINAKIKAENQRIEAANGGAYVRKQAEIFEAEQALQQSKDEYDRNIQELPSLNDGLKNATEVVEKVELSFKAKQVEIQRARKQLSDLNASRRNPMAGYFHRTPDLLKAISEDREFRERPIGPVGMYIKLKDARWTHVLESQYASFLHSFIVTSKSDQQRMSSLLKRFNMQWCSVLIGNNAPIDTTNNEPDPQFKTILRVLDFENELVRRQMIINQAIEQTLLIEHREEALRIMVEGTKPKNARQAFVIHDTDKRHGIYFGYSGRGLPVSSPIKPPRGEARMQTNVEDSVIHHTEILRQLEQEVVSVEKRLRDAQIHAQRCFTVINQKRRTVDQLKVKVQRATTCAEDLQSQLESINPEDGHLDGLKQDLEDTNADIKLYEQSYGSAALEKQRLNAIALEKKRHLEALRLRIKDHEAILEKSKTKVRNREQARHLALKAKNNAIEAIERLRSDLEMLDEKREVTARRVAEFTEKAQVVSPRVPLDAGDTTESLQLEFAHIAKVLKAQHVRQGGSLSEISNAVEETRKEYEKAKNCRQGLENLLTLLKNSCQQRLNMFRRFQQSISGSSRINFQYLLSERGFRGKLNIDHKHKKLEVHVEPDGAVKSAKGRQTKTLSGGEKSFSSICLLLALWEAMGAPLRCLDEFDVFMDDVNRDVSTKMIISAARKAVGRQFILITPKALGAGVANGDQDVHMIKLIDPRQKGQASIDDLVEGE